MTVELQYKLHSKLLPVTCTVNKISLAGVFFECMKGKKGIMSSGMGWTRH